MDLFTVTNTNILPFDGEVFHFGFLLNKVKSNFFYNKLLNANFWYHDEILMYGKKIKTARKVAWFADSNLKYSYANTEKKAIFWTPELLELKQQVELKTGEQFNSCLLNLYHNGSEGMGWHQDNEYELGNNPVIASLSFGAARKFVFKHVITKQKVTLLLENGSLIVMKGQTQQKWLHCLPKTTKKILPRINLTFRKIYV